MKQSVFSGVATALVTPMTKDGFVNYRMLEKLIDFQIENHVDAVVLCGTTGEASTLTEAEHHDILVHAVAYAKGKIKIIAGVGSNDTKKAKRLTLTAKECNVDGVFCGHYHKNNTCIEYEGIKWVFGLKTGQYDYHIPGQFGGTLITLENNDFYVNHLPALTTLAPYPGGANMFNGLFANDKEIEKK
jgi:hypothetical protein